MTTTEDTPTQEPQIFSRVNKYVEQDDGAMKHYARKAAEAVGELRDTEVAERLQQQDDKQLSAIVRGFLNDAWRAGNLNEAYMTEGAEATILALFTTAQLQLVSELEGELPKKALSGKSLDRAYNRAIDQMTWNLERKKQELERGK